MLDIPARQNPPHVNEWVVAWQKNGDGRARDRLLRVYMPLIRACGIRYGREWGVEIDDAIQLAGIGALRAFDLYDPATAPLVAYISLWARAKIGRARKNELPVTLSTTAFQDASVVAQAGRRLRDKMGTPPSVEDLARETGLAVGRVEAAKAALAARARLVSIDAPLSEDADSTVADTMPADESMRPDVVVLEALAVRQASNAIMAVVADFAPRHREVFQHRLIEGLTMEETGALMGIIRQRVMQIEAKVVLRLRAALVDNPAAMALIGREVKGSPELGPPESGATGPLISIGKVEEQTGLARDEIWTRVGQGTFPRPASRASNGNQRWDSDAVKRWCSCNLRAVP